MNLGVVVNNVLKTVKTHSPEILTALGATGVATTAYLAARAGYKASAAIDTVEFKEGTSHDAKERFKSRAKLTWRLYIPPAVSGAVTIGCVLAGSKGQGRRTAAAVTAYSLTEKAFSEYKEHVIEQIGASKEEKIRNEIAQEKINADPPKSKEIIIIGNGEVLCCELLTMRYFRSSMEGLRKAENDLNAWIINALHVTLEDWYELIGLPPTSQASDLGWDSDKLMNLEFSPCISPDGEPAIGFDYNYLKMIR